ncbi:MAG: bifunctional 4'-phosphopantothenoylcysteine decarboxylase/phosphopantothenoylcysteine synthetase, partial [Selenomonadaceae bacterium]|nr:bifunctional 4'-phosphopantothenoylcysteine decarboxylase/phosphopantothenoylcysteine synthetase [Selenomonadaceae bacterium]
MLNGKKIVLGVTGGIAAYKCVDLASRLRKKGAEVHVILTRGAQNFVTETAMRE